MTWTDPCLRRCRTASGDLVVLGVPQLDTYLEFLAARSRPNTVLAVAYDLKVFFTVVGKPPERVVAADVLGFVTAQRAGAHVGGLQLVGDVELVPHVLARLVGVVVLRVAGPAVPGWQAHGPTLW